VIDATAIRGYNRPPVCLHSNGSAEDGAYGSRWTDGQGLPPRVAMAAMEISDPQARYYYPDEVAADDWSVAQSAFGNGGSRWLPVRPTAYAAAIYSKTVAGQGHSLRNMS